MFFYLSKIILQNSSTLVLPNSKSPLKRQQTTPSQYNEVISEAFMFI